MRDPESLALPIKKAEPDRVGNSSVRLELLPEATQLLVQVVPPGLQSMCIDERLPSAQADWLPMIQQHACTDTQLLGLAAYERSSQHLLAPQGWPDGETSTAVRNLQPESKRQAWLDAVAPKVNHLLCVR